MNWTEQGADCIADGELGNYRISKSLTDMEYPYFVSVKKGRGRSNPLGNFSTLKNAKWAVERYENYRVKNHA